MLPSFNGPIQHATKKRKFGSAGRMHELFFSSFPLLHIKGLKISLTPTAVNHFSVLNPKSGLILQSNSKSQTGIKYSTKRNLLRLLTEVKKWENIVVANSIKAIDTLYRNYAESKFNWLWKIGKFVWDFGLLYCNGTLNLRTLRNHTIGQGW